MARHGETEYNRRNQIQGRGIDAPLNETGRSQARAIAEHVAPLDIRRIYSSSLKRSCETAEVIARNCRLDVESYQELDEMNFGALEGRPIAEIETELDTLHNHWKAGNVTHASEEGESPQMVLDRAATRAEAIIKAEHVSNLLFVLHGRLIRILLSHWLQMGLSAMHRIEHSNGALYHLQWDGRHFEAVYLNNTEHLQKEYSN